MDLGIHGKVALVKDALLALREALAVCHPEVAVTTALEREVGLLHERYASTPPGALLVPVRRLLRLVARLLNEPQRVAARQRLVRVAGHLAGLRAWLAFDLGEERVSQDWCRLGLRAAVEGGDADLGGWLLGVRSLLPSYHGGAAAALGWVERGQRVAGRGSPAVRCWLDGLEARSCAALRRDARAREALARAEARLEGTAPDQRLHGMDFAGPHLDLSYYRGTSLVLLRRPSQAQPLLVDALAVQGSQRRKGRSIVLLALATTYLQQLELERACELAGEAMALPAAERIGPITARWRELREGMAPWQGTRVVRELDDRVAA